MNTRENPYKALDKIILGESGVSDECEQNLYKLCDEIGARFAGAPAYRRAADYMLNKFNEYGLEHTSLEPFEIMAWRRGEPARLCMTHPNTKTYRCLELPYSGSTPADGVTGDLYDLGNGKGLTKKQVDGIKGRLVLSSAAGPDRRSLMAQCVEQGALGLILFSTAGGTSLRTGSITSDGSADLPAVVVSGEDALHMQRLAQGNTLRVKLNTFGRVEPAITWNVVGELPGKEAPDEWVIIGGHLDSHEIGPGAFDNGAGAVQVMEVARLLSHVRNDLKRTVRFVGFAGEEIGLSGSHYHAQKHEEALKKARFMLNSDMPGLSRPRGLVFHKCEGAEAYMRGLSRQMQTPISFNERMHRHSDHYPFVLKGLPTAGVGAGDFGGGVRPCIHMAEDTVDKLSVLDLRECSAFVARFLIRAANDDVFPLKRRSAEALSVFLADVPE